VNWCRFFCFIILVLIGSVARDVYAYNQSPDLRVVQSDGNGLILEYKPQYEKSDTITNDGITYIRFQVANTVVEGSSRSGAPEIYGRMCPVQCPGEVGNRVEVISADYEDVTNILLAPVPTMRKDNVDFLHIFKTDPKEYSVSGFVPSELVRFDHIGETRGIILGNLWIASYQYNPILRTVRKYKRIVVSIHFGPASRTLVNSDNLTRGIAINESPGLKQQKTVSPRRIASIQNGLLASGSWFRFPVTVDGIYKLTGQALLNAGIPATVDPNTIQIYGNGGYEVPMSVTDYYPSDLRENAIYVHDGGSAEKLDAADYIIFFGKGTRGWNYSSSDKQYHHYLNHYTETNFYWLTYGQGVHKAMPAMPVISDPSPYQLTSLDSKFVHEDEKINILSSGLEWLGVPMNPGDQILYMSSLPGLDPSRPINYRFHVGASSSETSTITLSEHGSQLGTPVFLPGTTIGDDGSPQLTDAVVQYSLMPNFNDRQSQIRVSYVTSNPGGSGYLDWFELFYGIKPSAQNDLAVFSIPDTAANVLCAIDGFSGSAVFVFDVTAYDSVTVNTNPQRVADSCIFQIVGTPGTRREIYAVGQSGYKFPGSLTSVANQNLHGDTSQADEIIIANSDIIPAAQRLQTYREHSAPLPLRVKVVDVNQIYNEFGGGLLSPGAIRNYLRYVYTNWSSPPAYAFLFGTGTFDYREILGSHIAGVPAWETDESSIPIYSYATDDDFTIFTTSDRVNMGTGRLTPRSIQEANVMVDKIIEYETRSQKDSWKIRTTFVADDALAGVGLDGRLQNDGTIHLNHAENVEKVLPSLFEQIKIYEFSYPTVYSASGRRKPDVNKAIVNQINEGTMLLNYSGHGNPDLWSHEHIFVRETDFPLLTNKGRYFFLIAATCNFSEFDGLDQPSGGEVLVSMPNAGAISVFSATRAVEEPYNEANNIAFAQQLFQTDQYGRVLPVRLGDVVYRTKQGYAFEDITNDRKYFLLGDPALSIGFPSMFASIDSIDHHPGTQVSQLHALGKTSIDATVRDSVLQPVSGYSGSAQVVVYDADQTVQLNDPDAGLITFKTEGGALFRGSQTVSGGSLVANFIVPKDISYGNDFGRIRAYFSNSSIDGAGYSTNITFGGVDSSAPVDTKGPDIRLYLDNRGFRPGDIVSATPLLISDLSDSSGINTSGSGVGHRLEMWLDDNAQSVDLSTYYQTDQNTYTRGTIQYPLGALSQGSHKVRLRGWDTYNNSSTVETIFEVVNGAGLQLNNIYNFPNPFRTSTFFTFQHNQVVPIDAEVKIFTVAGRLIQSLKLNDIVTQFVQIPWDGRDREGDVIANGVYLYKIIASTQDHRFTTEALGKMSVER
jgi:hypothetical protein